MESQSVFAWGVDVTSSSFSVCIKLKQLHRSLESGISRTASGKHKSMEWVTTCCDSVNHLLGSNERLYSFVRNSLFPEFTTGYEPRTKLKKPSLRNGGDTFNSYLI